MSQIRTSTKPRLFKRSKNKTTPEKVLKDLSQPPRRAERSARGSSQRLSGRRHTPQPSSKITPHSVINREIFGKSKVLFGKMNWKWGIVGVLIVLGLMWNFLALSMLISSLHSWLLLFQQRQKLTQEMNTWESIAKQYPNYRDAYVEGALYAYRLGDRGKEQYFLSQLQLLDPNFPLTKTLEQLTNLQETINN